MDKKSLDKVKSFVVPLTDGFNAAFKIPYACASIANRKAFICLVFVLTLALYPPLAPFIKGLFVGWAIPLFLGSIWYSLLDIARWYIDQEEKKGSK